MKASIAHFVNRSCLTCRSLLLLSLTLLLVLSACSPKPTPTPAPIPLPTILPARTCNLGPGETIPLVAMGIPGDNVAYTWSASTGTIIPPNSPTVNYKAPDTAGDVIIKVVARKGEQTSEGMITCSIIVPPTATFTETPVPTPTNTLVPTATIAPSSTPAPCPGSSSAELIAKDWKALGDNDPEMALACSEAIIANWTNDADQQQMERVTKGTCESAVPNPRSTAAVNAFHGKYWALNDVATAWFLRGEALTKLGRSAEAKEAYQTVVNKYSCGYAWDASVPTFWKVADAAKKK